MFFLVLINFVGSKIQTFFYYANFFYTFFNLFFNKKRETLILLGFTLYIFFVFFYKIIYIYRYYFIFTVGDWLELKFILIDPGT
jgi:hypothetical protein